jgi:hypothetical protein
VSEVSFLSHFIAGTGVWVQFINLSSAASWSKVLIGTPAIEWPFSKGTRKCKKKVYSFLLRRFNRISK